MNGSQNQLLYCRAARARVTYETAQQLYHAKGENPLPTIPDKVVSIENFLAETNVEDERYRNICDCEICGDKCATRWDIC